MEHSALFTEPYALHALQAYAAHGMGGTAVFDVIVRTMPADRNFLVAAGLAQAVDYLVGLRFTPDDLDWLEHGAGFPGAFVRSLSDWRFTGDLDALPEGTVFFAGEPVVRISAPLGEATLVVSGLVNLLQYPTLVASRAVRCVLAAAGRGLIDDGLHHTPGGDAALAAARACFLVGYDATAATLAGRCFGIPVAGSLAHSFIQAYDREEDAFGAFARLPENRGTDGGAGRRTLLVDNDDVPRALERVVRLARGLRETGEGRVDAIRIDSGDLAALSRLARGMLDSGGCADLRIVVGGDLDEHRIAELVSAGAPIDVFAVGACHAARDTSAWLDCVCSLAAYGGSGRRGRMPGAATWPGCKQVFRCRDDDGVIVHDTLGLQKEAVPGTPLLEPVLRSGERVCPCWSLAHVRQALRTHVASLPAALRGLSPAPPLPVLVSPELRELARQVDRRIA